MFGFSFDFSIFEMKIFSIGVLIVFSLDFFVENERKKLLKAVVKEWKFFRK